MHFRFLGDDGYYHSIPQEKLNGYFEISAVRYSDESGDDYISPLEDCNLTHFQDNFTNVFRAEEESIFNDIDYNQYPFCMPLSD